MHRLGLRESFTPSVAAASVARIATITALGTLALLGGCSSDGDGPGTDASAASDAAMTPLPDAIVVDAPMAVVDGEPSPPQDAGVDAFSPDVYPPSPLASPWEWTSVALETDGGVSPTVTKQAFAFGLPDRLYLQGGGRNGVVPGRVSDELAFASQVRSGDVEIQAFVRPTGSCKEREGKFGAMLRQDLSPASAYVAATLTGSSVERVQYRLTAGATARVAAEFDRTVDPVWVRLVRRGNTLDAWMSGDGDHWWKQRFAFPSWTDPYRVGLFVSSRSTADCDAIFEHTRVRTPLPDPWQQTEVGTNDIGVANYANGTFLIDGAGTDIDGTHDRFFFARQPANGDVQITARLTEFDGSDDARAGLMIRAGTVADAPMAAVLFDTDGSLLFLARSDWGTASANAVPKIASDLPSPLRLALVRSGDQVAAYYAGDGQPWKLIGTKSVRPPLDQMDVGLAVAAGEATSRARIDSVEVTATPTIGM